MDWIHTEIHDRSDAADPSRTTSVDQRDAAPSTAIAVALAELEETPPSRTEFTLADEVDPDALDDLVTTDDVRVEFTVDDYLVVVRGDGTLHIRTSEGENGSPRH